MLERARRLLLLTCALSLVSCPGMGQMLRLYGYTEIKPPSKLFAPGTMVWVKTSHPFSAGVICTQDMSLGSNFRPISSPTAGGDLSRATEKEFSLDTDYLDVLRADTRFTDITNVRVKLENPMLYELTDVDVIRYAAERSPMCRHALAQRHNAGYKVTMIASALKADVTYTVSWKSQSRLDAGGKVAALRNLALELGAERSSVSEQTIAAKDLYWGIKDDVFLARLSDPADVVDLPEGNRAISAAVTPAISRVTDLPAKPRPPVAKERPTFFEVDPDEDQEDTLF